MRQTDTIAALSTPPGESGIAVVRLTGPDSISIVNGLLTLSTSADEHRRIYHGDITDDAGDIIDDVIVAVMRAPDTYTGDDVVEISCHGSTVIAAGVLDALFARGARPAEPGEFTRRAFLNGKMDLLQAEAVADLIHARSDLQRRVAREQLAGAATREIESLADETLELLGIVEANIDFIEEDIDTIDVPRAVSLIDRQAGHINALLETEAMARPLRDGYRVAIVGAVNAGKSSLFNRLLGEARAIVTDIPGTTRDVLRETIEVNGLPFTVHDTAGLRADAVDDVEAIGVGLATEAARNADVVLLVRDQTVADPISNDVMDLAPDGRTIVVWSKSDLPAAAAKDTIIENVPAVAVSSVTGEGIADLREAMFSCVGAAEVVRAARERVLLNTRVAQLLREARGQLDVLREGFTERKPLELLAIDARAVLSSFERITGRTFEDGVLDVIFSRFCIGK